MHPNDTRFAGTIAVVHRGEVVKPLSDWLGAQREAYPGQLYFPDGLEGNQIARQRSVAAERMQGHFVLYVDSDCVPPRDALERLLSHEVPIVGGIVYERTPIRDGDRVVFPVAASRDDRKLRDEDVAPAYGLIKVDTVGMACTLVRREVFERLDKPYFRCGQIHSEYLTEDTEFCLRAMKEGGFPTHLDCRVRVKHRVIGYVEPGGNGRRVIEWGRGLREVSA